MDMCLDCVVLSPLPVLLPLAPPLLPRATMLLPCPLAALLPSLATTQPGAALAALFQLADAWPPQRFWASTLSGLEPALGTLPPRCAS